MVYNNTHTNGIVRDEGILILTVIFLKTKILHGESESDGWAFCLGCVEVSVEYPGIFMFVDPTSSTVDTVITLLRSFWVVGG